MTRLRVASYGFLLLICTLAVALAAVALTPGWYQKNCQWHGRCTVLGDAEARAHIRNLRDFFLHRSELVGRWSDKERRHLDEVRSIYLSLAVLSILAIAIAGVLFWRNPRWIRSAALMNYLYLLCIVLIVPAFGVFWRDVFHPLFFANNDWLTDANDVTWYITPRVFFRNSLVAMVVLALMVNTIVYLVARRRSELVQQ